MGCLGFVVARASCTGGEVGFNRQWPSLLLILVVLQWFIVQVYLCYCCFLDGTDGPISLEGAFPFDPCRRLLPGHFVMTVVLKFRGRKRCEMEGEGREWEQLGQHSLPSVAWLHGCTKLDVTPSPVKS